MSKAHIIPSRIRLHSTDLACDVVRGVGFRARCACGWEGPIRDRYDIARFDGHEHTHLERSDEAPPPPSA